ncbi:MAG: HD domain-containing protein [Deltaproteobacteria bacterium]|nr:HD domain-containing protein [Deltaproteobacteria bacterium]
MFWPDRMEQALVTAHRIHSDQRRKGTGIPYLTHLMAVSALVGEYGGDQDQMIAALLHDSLEDRPERISREKLTELFGWRVAHIVVGCSDCVCKPKPPWEPRKRAYLERVRHDDPSVKLVVTADKVHNTRALVRDYRSVGEPMWLRFNADKHQQCWYLRSCVGALSQGWSHPILDAFEAVVSELELLVRASTLSSQEAREDA